MQPLDEQERRILRALQKDGRMTVQELSEAVGLSASPTWRRVKALEERGVIRRYTALLDARAAGVGEVVFAHITLERHHQPDVVGFEAMVRDRPEVLECYATTGDADFLLKIAVATVADYDRFLQDFIVRLPGLRHVRSHFALREIKFETAIPL